MNSNIESEFLKQAKKSGKIRSIKEAFEEYPVEEEWHQGKIENVFKIGEVTQDKVEEYKEAFYKNLKQKRKNVRKKY